MGSGRPAPPSWWPLARGLLRLAGLGFTVAAGLATLAVVGAAAYLAWAALAVDVEARLCTFFPWSCAAKGGGAPDRPSVPRTGADVRALVERAARNGRIGRAELTAVETRLAEGRGRRVRKVARLLRRADDDHRVAAAEVGAIAAAVDRDGRRRQP